MHGNGNLGDLESVLSIRISAAEILCGTTGENVGLPFLQSLSRVVLLRPSLAAPDDPGPEA